MDISHPLPAVPFNPATVAPPIGKYSHLVPVDPGAQWVFISGQVGAHADGTIGKGAYEQTHAVFSNIEQLLTELDATPRNIVRLLTFVAGVEHLPEFYRARDEVYARWYPDDVYCGHSLAVVAALADPKLHLEMEGWVALSPTSADSDVV
ncbi:RidA family protein [Rhodococcus sp. IEGM 1366]|uniref:RidA family protein n=1 Tax=Rhodococcus sp. IEGM 1366 TaxID=3082223 RepID=UPI0029538865|nr:RidA family protein [Rhodococcus sp. IEGM 1366]MDV8071474.1 RidA family protein [Rhodococcus sp. IEGM 1366]